MSPIERGATVDANGKGLVKSTAHGEASMNRPHNTELVLDPHVAQWAVRFIARVGGLYAVVIGLGILFGGRTRFAAPAYQVALHVPGAPWSWASSSSPRG